MLPSPEPVKFPFSLFAASLALQLLVAAVPDRMADLLVYRQWTRTMAVEGLEAAYWPPAARTPDEAFKRPPVDYPPVFPYVLGALGRACRSLAPELLANDRRLDFLIRVPLVVANATLGVLLFVLLRHRSDAKTATGIAALFVLNPAVVFDTAYWGQADALLALLVVAGLVLAPRRPEWGWVALAAAALVKPLAYPFLPLVLLETAKRRGWKRASSSAIVGLATWGALLLPFLAAGRLGDIVVALFFQLDAMPYVSVNAHNAWWIIGRGVPWTPAWERAIGPVTYETLGLVAFGAFYLAVLVSLWRSTHARALHFAAASVAFGLFVLTTHMHENHLFTFIPLLLLAGGERPGWRRFCVAISAVMVLNMALHDPFLKSRLDGRVPGPRVTLPPQLEPAAGLADYLRSEGYPEAAQEMAGDSSVLRLAFTLLNSQACVLLFAYWVWSLGVGRGWAAPPEPRRVRLSVSTCVWIAIFCFVTGAPFLWHLARAAGHTG